jgi:hypothetical protein
VIAFEQRSFLRLDWPGLATVFENAGETSVVSVPALQSMQDRSAFFKKAIGARLRPAKETRIVILLSGSQMFTGGSDVSPIDLDTDCNCRIYRMRFRLSPNDVFDDFGKLLKLLRPKTWDITSARDFRKSLAELAREINRF